MDLIGKQNTSPISKNDEVRIALKSDKLKDSSIKEIGMPISDAIDRAIMYLGLNKETADVNLLKMMVIEDSRENFPSLTISEVVLAIKNGSHGFYGEVFGMAPKDCYNWILSYTQSEHRKMVIQENEKAQKNNIEPTDEQKEKIAWNNLLCAFEFYQANGYFNDFGNSVYNTLDVNGKINFTKERKLQFKSQALINLEKLHNPVQHVGNIIKINEARAIIEEIRATDNNSRLISESKKIALNVFFKELEEMDMDIKDLFQ